MEIIINEQLLEFSLENEKTVGDILFAIEQDCAKNKATIIRICINGNQIDESDFDAAAKESLETVKTISLETMSESDVLHYLQELINSLPETIAQLLKIPVLLQSNKDAEVSNTVISFADTFKDMQKLVSFCGLFPQKFNNFTIGGENLSVFFQDFIPILQEFESSLETRDTVLTGDLAEYEIAPRLQAFVDATTTQYGELC